MKNLKRIFVLLIFVFTLVLVGCTPNLPTEGGGPVGPGGSTTEEFRYKGKNVMDNLGPDTGTITFQVGGGSVELQLWDRLIADFEGKNPGIKVEKNNN